MFLKNAPFHLPLALSSFSGEFPKVRTKSNSMCLFGLAINSHDLEISGKILLIQIVVSGICVQRGNRSNIDTFNSNVLI